MKKLDKQLKKAVEHIRMSDAEHSHLRSKLREIMSYTPQSVEISETSVKSYVSDAFLAFRRVGIASVLLVVFVFIGGLSALADRALPGHLLYPVKIGVFEELRDIFALGTAQQARLEVKKLARRVDEVAQLQAQGSLDTEEQKLLEEKIRLHEEKALALAEILKEEDKIAEALNIEADVTIHSQTSRLAFEDTINTSALGMNIAMSEDVVEQAFLDSSINPSTLSKRSGIEESTQLEEDQTNFSDTANMSLMNLNIGEDDMLADTQEAAGAVEVNDADYKKAAERQKNSYEKVRAEIELMTAFAPKLIPSFKEKYDEKILTPLESIRELVKQGNAAFKEEQYKLAFDRYTEAHAQVQLISTQLKTGSWAEVEDVSEEGTTVDTHLVNTTHASTTENIEATSTPEEILAPTVLPLELDL